MASTTFISRVTKIAREWLQDVNDCVYGPTAPATTLRGQLASTASAADGAGLSGASQNNAYASGTLGAAYKERISVKDHPYLAKGDGVTDDTAAIVAFRNASPGKKGIWPPGTYVLGSATSVGLLDDIDWEGFGKAVIKQPTANTGALSAVGRSNIKIKGITFEGPNNGTTADDNAITFQDCTNCKVDLCDFSKWASNGVKVLGTSASTLSSHVHVTRNYFHDWSNPGSIDSSGGVAFVQNTRYCIASNNTHLEDAWNAVFCQDTIGAQGYKSAGHQITNNTITAKRAYGILVYENRTVSNVSTIANNGSGLIRVTTTAAHGCATGDDVRINSVVGTTEANGSWVVTVIDATRVDLQGSSFVNAYVSGGTFEQLDEVWTRIEGNLVRDIDGALLAGASGAGIYVVGVGNVRVCGNTVINSNISTTVESLAPGGIGINNAVGDVVCTGNTIERPNWYGVLVTSCLNGKVSVSANAIRYAGKNSIYVSESSGVSVVGNVITPKRGVSGAKGIRCNNSTARSGLTVSANVVETYSTRAIEVNNFTDFAVTGNTLKNVNNVATSVEGMAITNCARGTVTGNAIDIGPSTESVMYISDTTSTRVSANTCTQTAGSSNSLTLTGGCTGTLVDETNFFSLSRVANSSSGGVAHTRGTSAPVSAARQVGDINWNSSPVSGGTIGWVATTAGDPPTWKTFGVIA